MLDTGTGQKGDPRLSALAIHKRVQCRYRRFAAQGPCRREEASDFDVIGVAFTGEGVMHQREMHRPTRLRPHGAQRMAEPVIEIPAAGDRLGQARERRHDGSVVERRLAGVLEGAKPLHINRHLAGHDQHRRGVGLGGGDRGRHVAGTRTADPERRTERAAGTGIAVGHVDRTALVRRNHRCEPGLPGKRREEGIHQAARNHEQVTEPLLRQCVQDVVGTEYHRKYLI